MRAVVYTDYTYQRRDGSVYSERAFSLFVAAVASRLDGVVVVGREAPLDGSARYPIGEGVDFVPLPFYASLAHPVGVIRAVGGSLRAFWRSLDDVDVAWLLGPHPLAVGFAALARLRGRRVVLGVRQDLPAYIRSRRPGRRDLFLATDLLERIWRRLARRMPVVVVGPELALNYKAAPRRLEIAVSLVRDADIVEAAEIARRRYDGELRIVTVGRLEAEKNPLLLADVLGSLREDGRDWKLVVAGEGGMRDELAARFAELGVAEHAQLVGYVPVDGGLFDIYRSSHLFLHVSWTEGLPQVLVEAFAAGLPVVATDVGGVRAAVGGCTELIPPGDAGRAAAAVRLLIDNAATREQLIARGTEYARSRTLDSESARVASFLGGE